MTPAERHRSTQPQSFAYGSLGARVLGDGGMFIERGGGLGVVRYLSKDEAVALAVWLKAQYLDEA